MVKRFVASLVCLTFLFSNLQYVHAQASPATGGDFSVNQLPVPGTMVSASAPFAPLSLKGIVVNPQKPLEFQFIVDTGKGPQDVAGIKEEANRLVKYFLAGLTIPEGDLWVNLSPYEKERITTRSLGLTELGRDLLAQDYILKQLTASLIYPEKDLGREFWSKVYAKAQQQFGTTDIPVNTFNKVWILPNQAQVFENGAAAYVTRSTLKVMLDEDYLALQKHADVGTQLNASANTQEINNLGSQIVRQIVLPEIEKEVNTGKNFAPIRQIYQALILAKWYKETIQNGLLDAVYTNKMKTAGVNLADPAVKAQIYNRYLQAYKKGVFNYIKEDATSGGQSIPRKYFSGGTEMQIKELDRSGKQGDVNGDGIMEALTVDLAMANVAVDDLKLKADKARKVIDSARLKVTSLFSDGKIAEATKSYSEYLRAINEYNMQAQEYNIHNMLNITEGIVPRLGIVEEAKEEKESFESFSKIEAKLKEAGQSALWDKDLKSVLKQYAEVDQLIKVNKFYRAKRAEFDGIGTAIAGIVDALGSYYKLIDGSADVNDATTVVFYAMRELSRDQNSPIGQEIINKMWFEAGRALIIDFKGKPAFWKNDPSVSAVLSQAAGYFKILLEGPIGNWQDFKSQTIIPFRSFLASIDPGNVSEPSPEQVALYSIMLEKYVSLSLKMIEDPGFQTAKFSQLSTAKMFWYSGAPGAGKDLFINFFKQKVRWLREFTHESVATAKPTLFTERGIRPGEEQGKQYHYVLREFLQKELSERMFQSAKITSITYSELLKILQANGLAQINVDVPEPDGTVKTGGDLIDGEAILAMKNTGIEELLPATVSHRDRKIITSILMSSAEMSARVSLPTALLNAVVNKQRQAMAIESFVQNIHFYIDPDGTQNISWVEKPEGAKIVGLNKLLDMPQLVMAEVGRGFALQLQAQFSSAARAFISPITADALDVRFKDNFSYEKAYQLALKHHEEDIRKGQGQASEIEDRNIGDPNNSESAYNVAEAINERADHISRWEAIIKYETVKNIHSRNIKEGGALTAMKDLKQRAEEAAIQVLEVLHTSDIEAAHVRGDKIADKYYAANGVLGNYTKVVENKRQPVGKDFMRQTFDLGNSFVKVVLDPVIDMAMVTDSPITADVEELLQWLGLVEKDREEIGSDTPMSVILGFYQNDPKLFMVDMEKWQQDFKTKLGVEVTIQQMLTADPKHDSRFEFFQLLDDKGNLLNKIKPRALVHYDGDWHRDVRILVLDPTGKKVFIQKRGEKKDMEPGLLADSVGGHTRIGESYDENAIREASEEIGLTADPSRLTRLGGKTAVQRDDINNGLTGPKRQINRSHYAAYAYQLTQGEFDALKKAKIDYEDGITPGGVVTKRFFNLSHLDTEAVFRKLEANKIVEEDVAGNEKYKRTGYAKEWKLISPESMDAQLSKVDALFSSQEAETIKWILKLGTGWMSVEDLRKVGTEHPEWVVDSLKKGFEQGKIYQQHFDKAQFTEVTPGGIDLNQINIHRTGKIINVQFDPAQLNALIQGGFKGFTPVIINVTPIQNPLALMGVKE